MTTELTAWDYILGTLICLVPLFICAFIPVVILVGGTAWIGKISRIFSIPSKCRIVLISQVFLVTFLASFILSYLDVQITVHWEKCFEYGSSCPFVDNPSVFNTIAQVEGTIRNLLPPPMRDNCYTGHGLACEYATRWMVSYYSDLWYWLLCRWFVAILQALLVMKIMESVFPDERKAKRKQPE